MPWFCCTVNSTPDSLWKKHQAFISLGPTIVFLEEQDSIFQNSPLSGPWSAAWPWTSPSPILSSQQPTLTLSPGIPGREQSKQKPWSSIFPRFSCTNCSSPGFCKPWTRNWSQGRGEEGQRGRKRVSRLNKVTHLLLLSTLSYLWGHRPEGPLFS